MIRILLAGAGKIGGTIAAMLHESGDWDLKVIDAHERALREIAAGGIETEALDITDAAERRRVIDGATVVISALPYDLNGPLAESAKDAGAHYFDLTEDVESMRHVKALAPNARSAIMPQCGLAPGFISIVANDLARRFDSVHSIQMRVGALPQFPANALMYNLTWSTVGLINEYCNPCEVIADGRRM
jgi:saccharopine dehydrogenase-like NADP-dependent oxidoreductase